MRVVNLCYIGILLQVLFRILFLYPALYWVVNNIDDRVNSIKLYLGWFDTMRNQLTLYSYTSPSSKLVDNYPIQEEAKYKLGKYIPEKIKMWKYMIRLPDLKTCCSISFEILSSDFCSDCGDLNYLRYIDKKIDKTCLWHFYSINHKRVFVD